MAVAARHDGVRTLARAVGARFDLSGCADFTLVRVAIPAARLRLPHTGLPGIPRRQSARIALLLAAFVAAVSLQ